MWAKFKLAITDTTHQRTCCDVVLKNRGDHFGDDAALSTRCTVCRVAIGVSDPPWVVRLIVLLYDRRRYHIMPYGISVVSLTFTPPPMPISYVPTTNNPTHYHVPHGKKKKKVVFYDTSTNVQYFVLNVNFIFMLFSIAAL